jgi:hypothetical protein
MQMMNVTLSYIRLSGIEKANIFYLGVQPRDLIWNELNLIIWVPQTQFLLRR